MTLIYSNAAHFRVGVRPQVEFPQEYLRAIARDRWLYAIKIILRYEDSLKYPKSYERHARIVIAR